MYTREIEDVPEKLIVNGKPVFGTFGKHPKRLDIRGVKRPFGILPVPTFISNLKIKSKIRFSFAMDDYIGVIVLFNLKVFGLGEVSVWNTKTKISHSYRMLVGPKARFIPHNLDKASSSVLMKNRYIRINWDRKTGSMTVNFRMHDGKMSRPTILGKFVSKFNEGECSELTSVCPSPTRSRCSATYQLCSQTHGKLNFQYHKSDRNTSVESLGTAFFEMNRTYIKFHHTGEFVEGFLEVDGKPMAFSISSTSQDAVDADKYNSNVLFYDGKTTALSPAVITHPFGLNGAWVIQDTENMIDLTFTPSSDVISKTNLFVLRTENHLIYGTFEGTLMTSSGEKLSFKTCPGFARKYLIRL